MASPSSALSLYSGIPLALRQKERPNSLLTALCLLPVIAACLRQIFPITSLPFADQALSLVHYLGLAVAAGLIIISKPIRPSFPVLLLIPWIVIGAFLSNLSQESLPRTLGLIATIVAFGPFLSGRFAVRVATSGWKIVFGFAVVITALSLIAPLLPISKSGYGLYTGITANPKTLAFNALIIFCSAISFIRRSNIIYFSFVIIFTAYTVFLTGSRSGIAILALCSIGALLARRPKLDRFAGLSIATILVSAALYYQNYDQIAETLNFYSEKGLLDTRSHLWEARMAEFVANPIIGVGVGVPSEVIYSPTPLQIKLGYPYINSAGSLMYEPGSSYLGSLSMTGAFGSLLLFFAILNPLNMFFRRAVTGDRSVFSVHVTIALSFAIHLGEGGFVLSFGNPHCLVFWLWLGFLYRAHSQFGRSASRPRKPAVLLLNRSSKHWRAIRSSNHSMAELHQ
jgi:O-antigen ligase